MGQTILPTGEDLSIAIKEVLRYLNPDGLRQVMMQEKQRWNLKPNTDVDYYENQREFKYTGELHNTGMYQRMEIRTFPDGGANEGYAGINVDSGVFGLTHKFDLWDKALSEESQQEIINRVTIGATAKVADKTGYGLSDNDEMVSDTKNRVAAMVFDPYDGRAYLLSNDDPSYVNNETRSQTDRLPERAVARVGDIPTRITQLMNDLDFVSDPDYRHTDNNFTDSNRYVLDNIDDRTFVYPEVSKDSAGNYIENIRVGLNGLNVYGESESGGSNIQPDFESYTLGDRQGNAINSYNKNKNSSGTAYPSGYFPGIFRSYEELCRVDLVGQTMTPLTHNDTPGGRRRYNYYSFDGKWSPNWFDRYAYKDSYLAQSLNPHDMEQRIKSYEPVSYSALSKVNEFDRSKLYQWRYNRVTLKYDSNNIRIRVAEAGEKYKVGDILRWSFGDDVFLYTVTKVGANGEIMKGTYKAQHLRIFEQDPSTHGVAIRFSNMSGVGHDAKLVIECPATVECNATQIKNNLYAYVDITPSVRSDNSTTWSDINPSSSQNGKILVRSTAAGPGYTGINSGKGGPDSNMFYEHGGNATAGVHVHLFKYVIDTEHPRWVIRDGMQIFLGNWVDQGPMGLERPCDIKALLFSNSDTNNFNNYYKFMLDTIIDSLNSDSDTISTNNKNSLSSAYIHMDQCDPTPDQRFTKRYIDPNTSECKDVDITEKVLYINMATGIMWVYNSKYRNDPNFGYGMRAPGWVPFAGAVTK